jgi:hypothetical protein
MQAAALSSDDAIHITLPRYVLHAHPNANMPDKSTIALKEGHTEEFMVKRINFWPILGRCRKAERTRTDNAISLGGSENYCRSTLPEEQLALRIKKVLKLSS